MDNFIAIVEKVNGWINSVVWGWPTIIMILGTGLLLTIRLKVMQVRKLKESISETIVPTLKNVGKEKKKDKLNSVSQFEAFCSAISGTVGTGNIIGTTSAILTGGPGAIFWMWISAFFGMLTNYGENVLGLYYRKKDSKGNLRGGSFYYIRYGLGWKWLAVLAAIFCMIAAVGMGGVQNNKISSTIATTIGFADSTIVKIIIGVVVAIFAALIIIGGIKRIGKIASLLIPFMTIIFIVLAIVGICINISSVGKAFALIFENIFSFKALSGGFGGYLFGTIIKKGMARGVFSNEAGLGSSVIAHSASETREPVKQGLWGIFEVFLDTFIICTLMALLILTTYISNGQIESFSLDMVDSSIALGAFINNFGVFGKIAFAVILPLFAFTTIMAWAYYGEKATEYLFSSKSEKASKIASFVFKVLFLAVIVLSSVISSNLIWDIDDTFNGLMALPNLVAVVILSGKIVKITKNYYDRKKGKEVKPMLSAYEDLNEEFIQDEKNGIE